MILSVFVLFTAAAASCNHRMPIPGSISWWNCHEHQYSCSTSGSASGSTYCCCNTFWQANSDNTGCISCEAGCANFGSHGHTETRTRYRFAMQFENLGTCDTYKETQSRTCTNGEISAWTGTFRYETCFDGVVHDRDTFCLWKGTAPSCSISNECNGPNDIEVAREGFDVYNADGNSIWPQQRSFGSRCDFGGFKVFCCNRPTPVNCRTTHWIWGDCVQPCGSAVGSRRDTRSIVVPARYGGNGCWPLERTVTGCTLPNNGCPITSDPTFSPTRDPTTKEPTMNPTLQGTVPVNCVLDDTATKATCPSTCGQVPGVGDPPASNGGAQCANYDCQWGDGECQECKASVDVSTSKDLKCKKRCSRPGHSKSWSRDRCEQHCTEGCAIVEISALRCDTESRWQQTKCWSRCHFPDSSQTAHSQCANRCSTGCRWV